MRHFRGSLFIAFLLAGAPLLAVTAPPAQAQFSASISFDSFHDTLSGYGDWLYSDRWGEVWRPFAQDRDGDWRPYWAGHWVSTREYGWTWISDEGDWGDIAYHYGRWVYDPDDGWLWLPGYVWSPAWVVWRSSGPDVGWMPMPPDDTFLRPGFSISIGFGDWDDIGGYYGYSRWYGPSFDRARFGRLWTFVPGERLADPGYRRYALARPQTVNIIQNSRNITNYTVVNNVIINRSVNDVAGRGGRAPQPVAANTALRSTRWVTRVDQGEQIQNRARQDRPRGNGRINSAPPPTQEQIRTLSTRPVPATRGNNAGGPDNNGAGNKGANDNRGGPRHLFSQANAQELQARARGGQPNAAPPPNAPQPGAAPQSAAPQNGPGPAAPDRNRDNGRGNARDNGGRDNNLRNDNRREPERQLPGTLPSNPPQSNVPQPNASQPNAPRPNAPSGVERPQAVPPSAGRPAPSDNPSTEDRRGPADRPPRALPGREPASPPPVVNPPERAAPREMPPPREQPSRDQPPRAMEQRMPPPERAVPPPREQAPPREQPREAPREQARPQAQPREQAPPREQARPNDRGQDRGRGNGRPDDNR